MRQRVADRHAAVAPLWMMSPSANGQSFGAFGALPSILRMPVLFELAAWPLASYSMFDPVRRVRRLSAYSRRK